MKLVIRTFVFHTICILLFSFVYFYFAEDFTALSDTSSNNGSGPKKRNTYIDFLLLSTTVQCGVGISDLVPTNILGKFWLIFQQYIMLLTHVITLYIFTL